MTAFFGGLVLDIVLLQLTDPEIAPVRSTTYWVLASLYSWVVLVMHYTLVLICKSSFLVPCIHTHSVNRALNIYPKTGGFVIASGAILGVCAGLLWTAQGSLMLSYPTERQKGRFIGIFWAIFNLGAVIGASVSLAINFRSRVRMYLSMFNLSDRAVYRETLVSFLFMNLRSNSYASIASRKLYICENLYDYNEDKVLTDLDRLPRIDIEWITYTNVNGRPKESCSNRRHEAFGS